MNQKRPIDGEPVGFAAKASAGQKALRKAATGLTKVSLKCLHLSVESAFVTRGLVLVDQAFTSHMIKNRDSLGCADGAFQPDELVFAPERYWPQTTS